MGGARQAERAAAARALHGRARAGERVLRPLDALAGAGTAEARRTEPGAAGHHQRKLSGLAGAADGSGAARSVPRRRTDDATAGPALRLVHRGNDRALDRGLGAAGLQRPAVGGVDTPNRIHQNRAAVRGEADPVPQRARSALKAALEAPRATRVHREPAHRWSPPLYAFPAAALVSSVPVRPQGRRSRGDGDVARASAPRARG